MTFSCLQSASEKLSSACRQPEADIDKIVLSLNTSDEFTVDEMTLMSVKPLVQWIAELCKHLLFSLPDAQG